MTTCTARIGIKNDEKGSVDYVYCGKGPAITRSKIDPSWCFCKECTEKVLKEPKSYGELEPIE